jgi:heme oxygenase
MDDETRAAFGRIDRYFELTQAQYLQQVAVQQEFRAEVLERLDSHSARLTNVEAEQRAMRKDLTVLRKDLTAMGEDLTAMRTDLTAMAEDLTALRTWAEERFDEVRVWVSRNFAPQE